MRLFALTIFALAIAYFPEASWAQQPRKVALVVGVSAYGHDRDGREQQGFIVPSSLPNAVSDANLVGDALETAGFTVSRIADGDKRSILSAISKFAQSISDAGPNAVGVFYFSGHGAQGTSALEREIDNFLIPIASDLTTEADLGSEAIALSRISTAVKPEQSQTVILILDACRNFALPTTIRSGIVTRGLAEARASPGTFIAYSTAPGSVATDGPVGANGPYARALAEQFSDTTAKRLEDIFYNVRNAVLDETNGLQVPWENNSLRKPVTFGTLKELRTTAETRPDSIKIHLPPQGEGRSANFDRLLLPPNHPDASGAGSVWNTVNGDELKGFLEQIDPIDGKLVADPATTEVGWATLPFYDQVALIRVRDPNWPDKSLAVYYLTDEGNIFRLNGTAPPVHEVNLKAPLKLTEDNVVDYLKFFTFFVHGEDGPFYILESIDDPFVPTRMNPTARTVIGGVAKKADYLGQNPYGQYRIDAALFYSTALFLAKFAVSTTGIIEMLDDEPIAADLPVRITAPLK